MPNTNEKLNLPIVNAIEDLKASNKDNRQRLQKSMRAGMLNIKKSVDSLHTVFIQAFELQKMKDAFDREKALEESRRETKDIQQQSSKKGDDKNSAVKLGLIFSGLAAALGTAVGSITAWTAGVVKATGAITSLVGKITGIITSGKFAKITAGLDDAVKKTKGWNTKILDVLKSGNAKLTGAVNSIKDSKFVTTISNWFKGIKTLGTDIADKFKIFKTTSEKITNTFKAIGGSLKAFGSIFTLFKTLANRVFWPLSIIFAGFKAIRDSLQSFADSENLEGTKTIIKTLVDELFMKPLDMVKDAIAWVIGKLGFDETADAVKSFSFSKLWDDIMDGLFNGISAAGEWVVLLFDDPKGAMKKLWNGLFGAGSVFDWLLFQPISKAVNWVKGLFSNPIETIKGQWNAMFGEGGVIDWLIFKPISDVINWIADLFGWSKEDAPKFNLQNFIGEKITEAWDSIKEIFNIIKDFDWWSLIPDDIQEFFKVGKYDLTPTESKAQTQKISESNDPFDDSYMAAPPGTIEVIYDAAKDKNQNLNDGKLINNTGTSVTTSSPVVTVVAPSNTDASNKIVNNQNVNVGTSAGRTKSDPVSNYRQFDMIAP